MQLTLLLVLAALLLFPRAASLRGLLLLGRGWLPRLRLAGLLPGGGRDQHGRGGKSEEGEGVHVE